MTISTASVSTTAAPLYTSSGNTVVTFLTLCNYSVSNVTANLYVVPSGGAINNTTIIMANLVIPAADTYQLYVGNEKLILANGDTIQCNVSANTAVNSVTSYTSA
jgi:hypothetical protein